MTGLGVFAMACTMAGGLTTLVEAASLTFLFTFAIVGGLAFRLRVGSRIVTGFGAAVAAAALVALIVRLIGTDPLALVFLGLLVLVAMVGRPILLRYTRTEPL